jgi:ABC-type lipoprotein release transport system permease subunit
MKFLLKLAVRNLFRHGRRTLITAIAIAAGLSIYIFMDSMLLGMELESQRNLVWYETSAARVHEQGYWAERTTHPLDVVIETPEPLVAALSQRGIAGAPRTVFSGELVVFQDPYPEDGSARITAYAIDPMRDDDVFRLKETIVAGRYVKPGEAGAVIGSWLAEDLGADVGYPLTIVTRTRQGYYQTVDLEIVGIARTPNPVINRGGIFLPLDTADRYLQMEGAVTEINMQLSGPVVTGGERYMRERTQEIETALASVVPNIVVFSWRDMAADYLALAEVKKSASGIILFLVFIIAAVGVSNTMLMSVYERTQELAMLRAMGMSSREIRLTFAAEATGIGILGALFGAALGAVLAAFLVYIGIDMGWMMRDMDIGYRIAQQMRGTWHPAAFFQGGLLAIVVAPLIALVPVRRALKMEVSDALRG